MKILAIETTGPAASAAVMDDENRIFKAASEGEQSHLQSLMSLVDKALRSAGITKEQLELAAVSAGPGSFTGIRIGIAAARTLAQMLGLRLVPVPALYSCVFMPDIYGLICPMLDAKHGNVYASAYYKKSIYSEPECLIQPGLYGSDEFRGIAEKTAAERGCGTPLFTGDGAGEPEFRDAELIAKAGKALFESGKAGAPGDYSSAVPEYLQKSEAEKKLETGRLGRGRLLKKRLSEEQQRAVELPPEDEAVTYRKVLPSETEKLASLDAECFSVCWNKSDFDSEFSGAGGASDSLRRCVYIAAENSKGELIGFAGITYIFDQGDVNRVAVSPLYRLRGIGGRLIKALESEAKDGGVTNLMLEVRESNRSGIALYKDCGFKVIDRRKHYYRDNGDNALIMRKEI